MKIYLDNAATTKPCEPAVTACFSCITENFGNPSSLHGIGFEAEKTVTEARKSIAAALVCEPDCIFFTSGATESNNTVIFGAAEKMGRRKKKIVVSAGEHSSVLKPMKYLEERGFTALRVKPSRNGDIDIDEFVQNVDDNTFLVSCGLVNNETGAINPVGKIFSAVKKKYPDCLTHTDAVQGFLKIPMKAKALSADFITLSAHKVHAIKGAGALYIKRGVKIPPFIYGGGQEKGMRSGTESVPLISAFGAAARALHGTMGSAYDHVSEVDSYLNEKLRALDFVIINYESENKSPFITNFSVKGIRSETLLHFLEERDIYVSSGSACSKGAKSEVLSSMGISEKQIDSAIRVSLARYTEKEDIDLLTEALIEAEKTLAKRK